MEIVFSGVSCAFKHFLLCVALSVSLSLSLPLSPFDGLDEGR